MANDWYALIVRPGFEAVVAQRLRKLDLEVFVPEQKVTSPQEPHHLQRDTARYVYCRLTLDNRLSVTSIPGVLDIVGTPDPVPLGAIPSTMQMRGFRS
jgi:transcription antitermination factor NusG